MAYNNNNYNDNYNNYNNDPYNNNQYYDNNQYNNQYNNPYNYNDPQFYEANTKRNKRNTMRQNAEYLEQYRLMQSQNNMNNYNNMNTYYNNNNGPVIRPKKNTKFVPDSRLYRLITIGVILLIAIIVGITILIINLTSGSKENTNTNTNTQVVVSDEQTVGNNSLGYLTIPSDWVKFSDSKGTVRGLQYSDINTTYILTMDALNATETDAEKWAKAKANDFQKLGVKDVKGAKVKIAGYDAYQVYGYYEPAKKWLSIWCFKVDKIVHYIGIEGPDNTSEYFKIVNTFKATKTSTNTNTNTTNTNTQKK